MAVNKVNNMAAIVDLGELSHTGDVKHLPPRAPGSGRPHPRGFQVRGRLFTGSQQTSLRQRPHSASTHGAQPADNGSQNAASKPRRVQSAHARVEGNSDVSQTHYPGHFVENSISLPGKDIAVYDVNLNMNIAKVAARNKAGKECWSANQHIPLSKAACRPSSAKSQPQSWIPERPPPTQSTDCVGDGHLDTQNKDLKPSVFGYRLQRQVYGSNPNIFTSSTSHLSLADFPFKLEKKSEKAVQCGGDPTANSKDLREMPRHLEPLRPWLNQNIPHEVLGIDPRACLVLLPMNQTYDDLPVVPLQ